MYCKPLNDSQLQELNFQKYDLMPDEVVHLVSNFRTRYGNTRFIFLLNCFESGKSTTEISTEFKVSRQQVYNWRNNFTKQTHQRTELIKKYCDLIDEYKFESNRIIINFDNK